MNGYTYSIQSNYQGKQYIVGISVKSETKWDADIVVMAHVVNHNTSNRLNSEDSLHQPRLVSIKEL